MEVQRKNSKKRQAILESLRSVTDHPTAEMIYNRLKPEYPDLSLGTVYRNLAMFLEEGQVISVGTVDGQERYDARTDFHAHLVCRRCRCVTDIEPTDEVKSAGQFFLRHGGGGGDQRHSGAGKKGLGIDHGRHLEKKYGASRTRVRALLAECQNCLRYSSSSGSLARTKWPGTISHQSGWFVSL